MNQRKEIELKICTFRHTQKIRILNGHLKHAENQDLMFKQQTTRMCRVISMSYIKKKAEKNPQENNNSKTPEITNIRLFLIITVRLQANAG